MRMFTRDKTYYRSLIALAVPIAMQNLITFAVNFMDNLMVGRLGDAAISGVYMGSQVQATLQFIVGGMGAALVVMAAQYWGKKDTDAIRKIVAIAMRITLAIGVLFTILSLAMPTPIMRIFTKDEAVLAEAVPYFEIVSFSYIFFAISQILIAAMRAVENAKIGMRISLVALVVNVVLNYIFIFGKLGLPALGAIGAAIATLISRVVEMVLIIVYVRVKDHVLHFRVTDLRRFSPVLRKDFFRYGLPIVGGDLVWSINTWGYNMILGRYNAGVITATSIVGMMNTLAFVWISGMSVGVGILIGKLIGAGEVDKVKEYAITTEFLFALVGIATGLIVQAIKLPFISLYNTSAEAAMYSRQFINVLSVTIAGSAYQAACLAGLVKAGGDTAFVMKNDTIFIFCIVLPSAIIASHFGAPVWLVFACLKSDQILKCIVALFKINSFNWIRDITRSEV